MKEDSKPEGKQFEFKIDGEQLYAPRQAMTVNELIQIAIDEKVLDRVEGGYSLEDGKHNVLAAGTIVDLEKNNVFYSTENEPGPAS